MDWKPDLCIYHGNCHDGFGAAWAIWKCWGNAVTFVPGVYGNQLPDPAEKNVLFVDFSAKQAELQAMAKAAKSIVVIDHHKTAQDDLASFTVKDGTGGPVDLTVQPANLPNALSARAATGKPQIVAYFDMDQSGAVMAWKFAHGKDRPPEMLKLIQDQDLWHFAFGDRTRHFSAALRSYPMKFAIWNEIDRDLDRFVEEGKHIHRAHMANLARCLANAYRGTIDGHEVPIVNVPGHYASDAGHEMLRRYPDAPFSASWFRGGDGMIEYELRSEDHRADVSKIARKFGGGGHRNAAGFRRPA
jgi:hypothetical protein